MTVQCELHIPVSESEARQRRLPPDCGKLLISADAAEDVVSDLSEVLDQYRGQSSLLAAQSLTTFLGKGALRELLDGRGLHYKFDSEISSKVRRPKDVWVKCRSREEIRFIMKELDAEGIVFYAIQAKDAEPIRGRLIELGTGGYQESEFLKTMDAIPLFIFYSSTHNSLEVLGTCEAVQRFHNDFCAER